MKKIFLLATVTLLLTACKQSQKYTDAEVKASVEQLLGQMEKAYEGENAEQQCVQLLSEFIAQHQDDQCGVAALTNTDIGYVIPSDEMAKLYEQMSDEMKGQSAMQELKKKLDKQSETAPGKKFVDFECEYNGKVQKLSDYVGKGKYVLVDFWASWCGPCKAEIPNIINVYKKYAGDQLEVIGVATWDKPEDTQKAIAQLGIPYPQIMNAQEAGSDAYSIEGIPEIILFAPDGTILKRGLREGAIEEAVKEALKK